MRNRIGRATALLSSWHLLLNAALIGALGLPLAVPAAAQVRTGSVMERKVTATFNQAPLESVLRTLRRQYGVRISYSATSLNLQQPVTLNVQNQPLRTVLDELLRDRNIGYELVGDQVVLHPAAKAPTAARPASPPPTATTTTVSKVPGTPADPTAPAPRPTVATPESTGTAAPKVAAPAKSAVKPESVPARQPAKPAAAPARQSAKPAGSKPASANAGGKGEKPAPAAASKASAGAGAKPTEATKAAPDPKATPATQVSRATQSAAAPLAKPAGEAAGATASAAPGVDSAAVPPVSPVAAAAAEGAKTAAQDSAAKAAAEEPAEEVRTTFTRPVQVSFLGPLGSNGLRSGQTVNHVSLNLLGGYAAGVDGFEAAGLFNIDRDSVQGAQVAGLANIVGKRLDGFQGAGLLNVVGGGGRGWQAAGLLNVAVRPVAGAQTAGLFNYAGPLKKPADAVPASAAETSGRQGVQAAGLFNVSLAEVRGVQAAGLFNTTIGRVQGAQLAGLFNVAGTVRGVQLAGLLNIADSVRGVSIAPINLVRHGYHRFEALYSDAWPLSGSLKLGGSAQFYTFVTAAYDNFGGTPRRWGLGYGAGTELAARRRFSLSLDLSAMQVDEENTRWMQQLNLHNQLRLLVGFAPFKAGGHFRLVAGPVAHVLVTSRYDAAEGRVFSNLTRGHNLLLEEGNSSTKVLGWVGYSVGLRF